MTLRFVVKNKKNSRNHFVAQSTWKWHQSILLTHTHTHVHTHVPTHTRVSSNFAIRKISKIEWDLYFWILRPLAFHFCDSRRPLVFINIFKTMPFAEFSIVWSAANEMTNWWDRCAHAQRFLSETNQNSCMHHFPHTFSKFHEYDKNWVRSIFLNFKATGLPLAFHWPSTFVTVEGHWSSLIFSKRCHLRSFRLFQLQMKWQTDGIDVLMPRDSYPKELLVRISVFFDGYRARGHDFDL